MNLREELKKEKIKEENNQNELKKIFIEYIKGNEISKVDENKILDELQNCINKKSYNESILENELKYCDVIYNDSKRTFNGWKKQKATDSNYQDIITELELVSTLPKAVQLMLEEIEYDRSFINYNEFLRENNVEPLKDNYSIVELEDTIVSIIKKYNEENKNDEWSYEIPIISKCNIATLFYAKDKQNIVLLLNSNSIDGNRIDFKDYHWSQYIYIKSLLRKGKKILSPMEVFGNCSRQRSSGLLNSLMKYNLKKYDIDKYNFIIYDNLSEDEIKKELEVKDIDRKKWNNTSKKLLKPFVKELLNKFEDLDDGSKLDFQCKKERLEQILNTNLKISSKNKKIFQLYGTLNSYDLIIIEECFFAIIISLMPSEELKSDTTFCNVHYGVFSDKDIFHVRNEEVNTQIDVSIPYINTKKASVVGRTIVGQAIGGQVGGLLGAYSAIEENSKRANIMKNHEPIIRNCKCKEYTISIQSFYIPTGRIGEYASKLFLTLSTSVFNQEEIENTIKEIKSARNNENLINGEIIKKYFEENNSDKFNEEDLENYIKKTRRDNYWKERPKAKNRLEQNLEELKLEEKNIQIKITNVDNENKLKIDKIKSKYNCKFEEKNQIKLLLNEIKELNAKSNKMSFLKFIEKNQIKKLLTEKKHQIEQLQIILEEKKDEVLKKIQPKIDLIEKDKNMLKTMLDENLKKQQEIIDELEKER